MAGHSRKTYTLKHLLASNVWSALNVYIVLWALLLQCFSLPLMRSRHCFVFFAVGHVVPGRPRNDRERNADWRWRSVNRTDRGGAEAGCPSLSGGQFTEQTIGFHTHQNMLRPWQTFFDERKTKSSCPLTSLPLCHIAQELGKVGKDDLVAMVLEARREKAAVEKRCMDLGDAFQYAQRVLFLVFVLNACTLCRTK